MQNLNEEKLLVERELEPLQKRLNKFEFQLKSLEEKQNEIDCSLCHNTLSQKKSKNKKITLNSIKKRIRIGGKGIKSLSIPQLISARKNVYTKILMLRSKISQLNCDIKPVQLKLKKINEELIFSQARREMELFLQSHQSKTLLEKKQFLQTKLKEVENELRELKKIGVSSILKLVYGIYSLYSLVSTVSSTVLPYITY